MIEELTPWFTAFGVLVVCGAAFYVAFDIILPSVCAWIGRRAARRRLK